ncbi:GNAT family N-acetyltransferase [Uliginosibacterium sp. 31-16]|uniref:GNAT family N-acetyltransferase n=1 Tax=Uliginosibacterium sp. 31-16 TaxID=3068315 RepID=UPI00273E0AD6|nr:GNAT family N-acetyltransferase [Uliginosibacterium sp. 31-16]MDP5238885.1 GNAT family N-acetyltransferase [Uliginosibacterium sp. 31-16]
MTDTPDDSLHEASTRDYRPTDAPALAAVYRAAILETGASAYTAEQCAAWAATADDAAAWAQRLQDNWVRVAEDETGEILGFGGILMPGTIDLLFVAPEANRQGVGSLILDDLLELAAAMGAKQVRAIASNLSKPFFEKHGFKLVESGEHERCGQSLACHLLVKG